MMRYCRFWGLRKRGSGGELGTVTNGAKIRLWRERLKPPGSPAEAGSCKGDRPIPPHLKMGVQRSTEDGREPAEAG